jgi:hypothetical protein
MTIPTNLPVRELNQRLNNIERCAEEAPEGTYAVAKRAADAIADCANAVRYALRSHGFKMLNDDRLRTIEAAIYGYLLESNPDETGLIAGEGFGEHVDGPNGVRVKEQAIRDRDALKALGIR